METKEKIVCTNCGHKLSKKELKVWEKAGFELRHLSCSKCGCSSSNSDHGYRKEQA